ncbi:hypothetical protein ONS95_012892 [Cadophora gregata]|uniref:uncharacterized protein n=1 Tax=Cadophora gregata TaxID=51156 RepID=UPI0026DD5B8B|nr:uncharacterized protein ONS95_012892 [Cadophora gregata]KAK0101126.1 hypothetical protein ONS96_006351 [Cadophora gregata f. sp. sojae]KAK0115842.1 hypothetical protein ONS95_012892 [Cadophora gregata]
MSQQPVSPHPLSAPSGNMFTLFPNLPPELRAPIWKHALTRRIVKWTRNNNQNIFTAPMKSITIFNVCKESREMAMLYGEYIDISTSDEPVFFSPLEDYLLFEPIWADLIPKPGAKVAPDPLDFLPPSLLSLRYIMVHPHYTDERKRPTALFEKLPNLEQVLVAADEKSIGFQSKFILGSAYDLKLYYAADVRKRLPDFKVPYIAVGCLGWTGTERRKMNHGAQDTRELVRVCENEAQMKEHLRDVREEEWKFTQEMQKGRAGLKMKLNFKVKGGAGMDFGKERGDGEKGSGGSKTKAGPPGYSRGSENAPENPPPYAEI